MSYFGITFWWQQTDYTSVIFILFLNLFAYVGLSEGVLYTPVVQQSSLCSNESVSCAHQLSLNTSEDACVFKKYITNSTECSSQIFKVRHVSEEDYGDVVLSAYVYKQNGYQFPAFNISFTDIKWSRAKFRFYESGRLQPDVCREFEVTPGTTAVANATLFYDCLWRNEQIEGHTYFFQLLTMPPPGADLPPIATTYKFRVPSTLSFGDEVSLKKLKLFVSVDLSRLPVLRLIVQTAPSQLNVTRYRVRLLRTWVDQKWPVFTDELTTSPDTTHLFQVYDTGYRPGIYNFTVQPIHDACPRAGCPETVTPEILIVATTDTNLLIVMVGTVILVPVLLAAYFMWRRTCVDTTAGNETWRPPKVLLVYNPDYTSHLSNMIRFTEYLKKCHIDPMLDIFCIPTSDSKDPTKWYREAFRVADFILVVASPPGPKSAEPHMCNPYLHLDKIALHQLSHLLAVPGPSCRVVCVLLPGCSWDTLPRAAARLRQFTLPRDLDPLLVCLGAAPQCDGGHGMLAALADTDLRPQPTPLPPPTPYLLPHPKLPPIRPAELTSYNLALTRNHNTPLPLPRPPRDDTFHDIHDMNLSGGC
ncbi:uncharacterized protein LOC111055884 [Nilaparvata lugens]|uniref:uncharacterized protein LOC111055884 n=1 Tax=Nilaparvata lugens TaxID=108931 RepID=UPI00193E311F|nr:uncharacterized protein LOC111055884 [Nilaparvata lugens]